MAASTEKAAADFHARQTVLSMSPDQAMQVAGLLKTVRETVSKIAAGPEPAPEPQKSEKTGKALTLPYNHACYNVIWATGEMACTSICCSLHWSPASALLCSKAGRREKNSNAAVERERNAASTMERPPGPKAQAKAPHSSAPKRESKPSQSHKLTVSSCHAGNLSSALLMPCFDMIACQAVLFNH